MARLEKAAMMVMVTAVLLVAPVSSSDIMKFETKNSWEDIILPRTAPVLTLIKFSTNSTTSAHLEIHYSGNYIPEKEEFQFSQDDDEKNVIAVLYSKNQDIHEYRDVVNMLTAKSWTFIWSISHILVWSNHSVTWEVAHNSFPFVAKTTAVSTTPTVSTALSSNQPSFYLNPAFLALAALCAILATATFVLSVLLCHICASSRSGLQGTASSRDDTTFKSTETLIRQQIPYPYNYNGRGLIHIRENSLYEAL